MSMLTDQVISMDLLSESAYVCVANVHMVVTAKKDASLLSVMSEASVFKMKSLFPDCEIIRERFLFMTKSFIAVRKVKHA